MSERFSRSSSSEFFTAKDTFLKLKKGNFSHLEKKDFLILFKEKNNLQKSILNQFIAALLDLFDLKDSPNPQTLLKLNDEFSNQALAAGVGFDQLQKEKISQALQSYLLYYEKSTQLLLENQTKNDLLSQLIGQNFPPSLRSQLRHLPFLAYHQHGLLHLEVTNNQDFYFLIKHLFPSKIQHHQKTSGLFIKKASRLTALDFALYKSTAHFDKNPYTRHESQHFFQHLIDHPPSLPTNRHHELDYHLAAGYQGVKDEILAYAKQGKMNFSAQFLYSTTTNYNYLQNYYHRHPFLKPTELTQIKHYYQQLARSYLAFQAFTAQSELSLNQTIAFFSTLPLPQWVKSTKSYSQEKNTSIFYNYAQRIKQNGLDESNQDSYLQLLQWSNFTQSIDFHQYLSLALEISQIQNPAAHLLSYNFLHRFQVLAKQHQPSLLQDSTIQAHIIILNERLNINYLPHSQIFSSLEDQSSS